MGLFANRWRTLREAAPEGVASLHVEPQPMPHSAPARRAGKLRQPIELQQGEHGN